jgi:peroxiredoxin
VLSGAHDIPIAATYANGRAEAAWFDANLNGDLSDDAPAKLYPYPNPSGSRAFLVDVSWPAFLHKAKREIVWKLRIVLEPINTEVNSDSLPRFRWQQVYAMVADVTLEGRSHRGFLFDGNSDGIYSRDYGDGLFVDLDDDGRVVTDAMSQEFIPFAVPVQIGGILFEVTSVEPEGASLTLSELGWRKPVRRAVVGEPAPDFESSSIDGRRMKTAEYRGKPLAIYFWASWCGACNELAPDLRLLYEDYHPRGLEIFSISMDDSLALLSDFESRHREPWPVAYFGRRFWENPIARLYGASATSAIFLIDPNGILDGIYYDFDKVRPRLDAMLSDARARRD